jgi:hypothetical protein
MDWAVLIDLINSFVITTFDINLISGVFISCEMRTSICWLSVYRAKHRRCLRLLILSGIPIVKSGDKLKTLEFGFCSYCSVFDVSLNAKVYEVLHK